MSLHWPFHSYQTGCFQVIRYIVRSQTHNHELIAILLLLYNGSLYQRQCCVVLISMDETFCKLSDRKGSMGREVKLISGVCVNSKMTSSSKVEGFYLGGFYQVPAWSSWELFLGFCCWQICTQQWQWLYEPRWGGAYVVEIVNNVPMCSHDLSKCTSTGILRKKYGWHPKNKSFFPLALDATWWH